MMVLMPNIELSVNTYYAPELSPGLLLFPSSIGSTKEVGTMKKFLKEALEYFAKTCEFVYSNSLV